MGLPLVVMLGLCLLLFWAVAVALGEARRVRMLYNECVGLNSRWRATCEFMTRKSIRDALASNQTWTAKDEQALRAYAKQLDSMGVSLKSLGMSDAEIATYKGTVVH